MSELKFGSTARTLGVPAYILDKLLDAGYEATLTEDGARIHTTATALNYYREHYVQWVWLPRNWFVESMSDKTPTINFYLSLTSQWQT